MLASLAWKNVWRGKRRSLILLVAIALGLWGGLFTTGIMMGFCETYVNTAIDRDLTHLQIHTKKFKEDRLVGDFLPAADTIAGQIRGFRSVEDASARTLVQAMASSPVTSAAVRICGVHPDRERRITTVPGWCVGGVYLDSAGRMSAFVGKTLANTLEVKLRSKIVLSFQAMDGTIAYGAFRVAGIYQTESSVFDGMNIFIRREDLESLLGEGQVAHEIAVRLKSSAMVESTVDTLRGLYPDLIVEGWKDLAPELRITAESSGLIMNIFLGVILFALLFGITNTMLMSVLDRVREFGVLIAVGMKRRRLFRLIIMETLFLAITGAAIGILLGVVTVRYFGSAGINLGMFSEAAAYFGVPMILYPAVPLSTYPVLVLMVVVTAVVAAVYPALKAARLRPAAAIRTYA